MSNTFQAKSVIAEAFESKIKDMEGTQLGFNGGLDYFNGGKVVFVKVRASVSFKLDFNVSQDKIYFLL